MNISIRTRYWIIQWILVTVAISNTYRDLALMVRVTVHGKHTMSLFTTPFKIFRWQIVLQIIIGAWLDLDNPLQIGGRRKVGTWP
jgi:hypothetical protein